MEFKKKAKLATDDLWYDLFEGGKIDVSKLLKHEEDVRRIKEAMLLLEQFKNEMETKKILEYY